METEYYNAERVLKLPPLILHPFSDVASPQKLVQSSRASLMIQGLLPNESLSIEELDNILLEGRYCEIRMLFYVGKDLVRWIDQCTEIVDRETELRGANIHWQSFATLLVEDPPPAVRHKLKNWGVADYRSIFSRAIGFNSVFTDVPARDLLSEDFIRNYHHYADKLYACRQAACQFSRLKAEDFEFDLYASGEYSRMLERQWQDE